MTVAKKLLIADDHPLFRQALSLMLNANFDAVEISEAETIAELVQVLLTKPDLDLLLLDIDIPGAQGFNTLINIRKQYPDLGIAIVSGFEDDATIEKAMHHGAAGFIPKSSSPDTMVTAIQEVLAGNTWTPNSDLAPKVTNDAEQKIASLTPQQRKILSLFADGMLNKQIAFELDVAESTVKSHASTIFLKLGVKNRTQAVIVLNEALHSQASFGQSQPT